ncbi:unnamed protein product [Calypogeia fissa]
MAACISLLTTGQLSTGGGVSSSLTSSFLSHSQGSTASCNKSSSKSSISGGSVSFASPSSPTTRGFSGARCRAKSAELEAPLPTATTLYGLLGLEQGVSLNDIKSSYRKLARMYHPDVCLAENREECTKMFMQVQDAYEVLSDPVRRAKYDYQLMNPLSPGSGGWGSMVRRSKENDIDTAAWRSAWREQLARFPMKERPAQSWAARMREKHAASQ